MKCARWTGGRYVVAVVTAAVLLMSGGGMMAAVENPEADSALLVLDDFSAPDGRPLYGVAWQGFTDRVMGGVSDMAAGLAPGDDGAMVLRMRGDVSLDNNGGFIQVRLALTDAGSWDASGWTGIAVEARSRAPRDGGYWIHLRTTRTRFPWSHYEQELPVTGEWQRIEIPFDGFDASYMLGGGQPDPRRLRSIGVVAAKQAFAADLEVRWIGLYR